MDWTEAATLARTLMDEHGLEQIPFGWTNRKLQMGCCNYISGVATLIELSRPLVAVNDETLVRNTILHEIAHAKVGCDHGHDWTWQSVARSIGCTATRVAEGAVKVPGNYRATCPSCGTTREKYRMPKQNDHTACIDCCKKYAGGRFDSRFVFHFERV